MFFSGLFQAVFVRADGSRNVDFHDLAKTTCLRIDGIALYALAHKKRAMMVYLGATLFA